MGLVFPISHCAATLRPTDHPACVYDIAHWALSYLRAGTLVPDFAFIPLIESWAPLLTAWDQSQTLRTATYPFHSFYTRPLHSYLRRRRYISRDSRWIQTRLLLLCSIRSILESFYVAHTQRLLSHEHLFEPSYFSHFLFRAHLVR